VPIKEHFMRLKKDYAEKIDEIEQRIIDPCRQSDNRTNLILRAAYIDIEAAIEKHLSKALED
jgi:flagellar biosynthesis regulator FlaF